MQFLKALVNSINLRSFLSSGLGAAVAMSLSALLASSFLVSLIAFVIQAILARLLGAHEYGLLASALASAMLVASLIGFGIPQLWLRMFGRDGWKAMGCVSPSMAIVFVNALISMLIIILFELSPLQAGFGNSIFLILVVHAIGQVFIEFTLVKFQLEEKYVRLSVFQLFPPLFRLFFVVLLALFFSDWATAYNVAVIYAFVSVFVIAFGSYHIRKIVVGSFALVGHKRDNELKAYKISTMLSESWPFGMLGILNFVYFQGAILIMQYFATPEEVGQYSVALSIMIALYLVPTVLYQKFLLPKLHRWHIQDYEKLLNIYRKGNVVMLVLGSFSMVAIWASAWVMIPFVFGESYVGAVNVINVLALCAPIQFLISSISASLLTHENTKNKCLILVLAVLVHIALCLFFIHAYGSLGAAYSTVVSSLVLLCGYKYIAKRSASVVVGDE